MNHRFDGFKVKENDGGVSISCEKYGNKFQREFHRMWKEQILCDATITTETGEEIPIHRAVLSMHSDYFRAMFTSGLQEARVANPKISLTEHPADIVKGVLKFMYTGILSDLNRETVQDYIMLMDQLQMLTLKNACCPYMEDNIDTNNCLDVWIFAQRFSCEEMQRKSLSHIKHQFSFVSCQENFQHLETDALLFLLHLDDLNMNSEKVILDCVQRWLENHKRASTETMWDIVRCIRFNQLTHQEISVFSEQLSQSNPNQTQEIDNYIQQYKTNVKDRPRNERKHIYVIGGYFQSRTGPCSPRLQTVEQYDAIEDAWKSTTQFPVLASAIYAVEIFGKLICFTSYSTVFLAAFEFDPIQLKWRDCSLQFHENCLKNMKECFKVTGAITYCDESNTLFVLCNNNTHAYRMSCDNGDLQISATQSWKYPMNPSLASFAAVTLNKDLYVLGGEERLSVRDVTQIRDVMKCNVQRNEWEKMTPLLEARASFDAVQFDGRIYVVGGFNNRRLRTAEMYSPVTDQWTFICSMNKERSHLKAAVLSNKLYVVGGKSYSRFEGGARKVLSSVEVYDSYTDTWSFIQPMQQSRCMFGAVVH
ncbi:actin-binding protein IPP-like [Saccostrea echinata]|uniref:actin-binding protein IPP-like n=1 Tax=Saccostrea echinata TaxID=191078 RepID=UPI002A82E84C|nr:actin-binding protein IPP-like [Saccostrea echinata]